MLGDLLGVGEEFGAQPLVLLLAEAVGAGAGERLGDDLAVRADLGYGLGAESGDPASAEVQQEGAAGVLCERPWT